MTTALAACQHQPVHSAFPETPRSARFDYSAIDLFWPAFDSAMAGSEEDLDQYLHQSVGAADFVATERIDPATFAEFLRAERQYYETIRADTLELAQYEGQIRTIYEAMERLYPPSRYPPLYYVVGQTFSGGTATERGLILGSETFSSIAARTSYGRPSFERDLIPYVVAHELVHFQQLALGDDATLLQRVLHEGGADFVAELISGPQVRLLNGPEVYAFGERHAETLWLEFIAQRQEQTNGTWLYAQTSGRPQNLGYWVGYRIAAAYYAVQSDKRRAIADIINFGDGEALLRRSGLPI